MATIGNTVLTLADWSSRMGPDNNVADIVEMLAQSNEILTDMRWMEGNLPTGHMGVMRTGLPAQTWRLLNYGVAPTKSTTVKVTDTCGMLEAYAEVDKALADLGGQTARVRASEAKAHIEGFGQTIAQTIFYGNQAANPERFTGLAPRFNTVNTATAQTAYNVVDAGGTGSDNMSMWLVGWGENSVHGIFPQGSRAGLQRQDLNEQTLLDANNGRYQGYREHFKWDAGLHVKDWRYIVRIANIDSSDLTGGSAADLVKNMIIASEKLPGTAGVTPVWYANRRAKTYLRLQILNKTTNSLTSETVAGKPVMMFDGIPVRTVDQLLSTEARIT